MLNPLVYETNARGMDDNNGVRAFGRHIFDESIAELVVETITIPAFGGNGVDEDETGLGSTVDVRIIRCEIPVDPGIVFLCSLLNCAQGLKNMLGFMRS